MKKMEVQRKQFCNWALEGAVPSASRSGHLNPDTHWIRLLVGPTAGLDVFKGRTNLTPTESQTQRLIVLPANGQNYIQEDLKNRRTRSLYILLLGTVRPY